MVTIAPGLLSAAELLTAHVRPRAEAVEERCRLDDVTATEISDAGFPAHFVPAVHGGRAGTFTELVRAVTELGEGCTSTAWCAALFAAHGRLASYLPERGRAAVWARGAQTRIAAAVVPPQGSAVAVSGGWQLSGRWTPASGVDHAQWILLASRTGDQHRIFAVPVRRCTILSTWDHVGLRGSGSNSVELDGVFVPSWSTMTLDDLARPHRDPDAARCHRVPFPLVAGLMFAAPALGAAQAAVADVVAALRQRSAAGAGPARPGTAAAVAEASAQVRGARLLLLGAAGRADAGEVTPFAVAENVRDCAVAVDWCVRAVERLVRVAGARGHGAGEPLLRRWRDVHAIAGHATLDLDAAYDRHLEALMS